MKQVKWSISLLILAAAMALALITGLPFSASAEETAVPLTTLYVSETAVVVDGVVQSTTSGTGWSFDSATATLFLTDGAALKGTSSSTTTSETEAGLYCAGDLKVVTNGEVTITGVYCGINVAAGSLELAVQSGTATVTGLTNGNGIYINSSANGLSVDVAEGAVLNINGTSNMSPILSVASGDVSLTGKGTVNCNSSIDVANATLKIDGITLNCSGTSSRPDLAATNVIIGQSAPAIVNLQVKYSKAIDASEGTVSIIGSTVTMENKSGARWVYGIYATTINIDNSTVKMDTLAGTSYMNYGFIGNLNVSGDSHIIGGASSTDSDSGFLDGKVTVSGNYYYRTDSAAAFAYNTMSAKADIDYFELITEDHLGYTANVDTHSVCCKAANCPGYVTVAENVEHRFEEGAIACADCGAYLPAELNADGVYEIGNLGQLMWFAQNINSAHKAILTGDITIDNTVVWTPISLVDGVANSSLFDGNGHTITFANTNEGSTFGLFGKYNYSIIENLKLAGSISCNTTENVGVLVNSAYRTTIRNVSSTCAIANSATSGGTGGLAGLFGGGNNNGLYSLIENCAVYADITGGGSAGGLIGNMWGGYQYCTVQNCAYVGNVAGSVNSGAIVGNNGNNSVTTSTFSNVYFCEADGIGWVGSAGNGLTALTNVEAKTAAQFASGEVAWLLGEAWGQTCGTGLPELDGMKVYWICDDIYSNIDAVALVGKTPYETAQQAVDNASGGYVKLLKDSAEAVTATGDLYLDLNGHKLASLTVTGKLYGMDSSTDDYDCADGYGTITSFAGQYERIYSRYAAIEEEGVLSFHRFFAGVTHMTLRPSNAGFGFKAGFYGDEVVTRYVTGYGMKVWLTQDKVQALALEGAFTSGAAKSLRIQNILTGSPSDAQRAQTDIYGSAYVTFDFDGETVTLESTPVNASLADLVNAVNGNTAGCTEAQLETLKAFVTTYKTVLEAVGCSLENILK